MIKEEELNVKKEGTAVMSCGMECISPNETYMGSENSLVLKMHYQAVFDCSFPNIAKYPFDKEECFFTFHISGQDNKLTSLVPKEITISSPSSVGQYQVLKWEMNETILQDGKMGIKVENTKSTSGILQNFLTMAQVTVKLGRSILSILMVDFLPTFLINMINQVFHVTRKQFHFKSRQPHTSPTWTTPPTSW